MKSRLRRRSRRPNALIRDSFDEPSTRDDNDIFNLLPPEPPEQPRRTAAASPAVGHNSHPVDMTDLSRLSIDREGRLYWDGKPVETHHRFVDVAAGRSSAPASSRRSW